MLKLLLVALVLVGLAIAGISIKLLFKKNGEFKKSCSSVDPKTGLRIGCTCESDNESDCKNI